MVCFTVPAAAALIHGVFRKNGSFIKNRTHHLWLNLLFLGAAIFGLVDHWWNGELFLIGENLIMDIMLGVTITISTIIIWGLLVSFDKSQDKKPKKS